MRAASGGQERVRLATADDQGVRTASGGALGGANLGDHAALGYARTGAAGHGFEAAIIGASFLDQGGRRIKARIGAVEAGLVGKNDQRLGLHQIGHQRPQRIVVAELDLVGDHRVVLVDDRHHAQIEQGLQGRAGIEVTRAVSQVLVGQQNLRGLQTVAEECGLVGLRQAHLTHRRCRLQVVHGVWPRGPAQTLHAGCNRPRADQQYLSPVGVQRRDLACAFGDEIMIQALAVVGDQCAADLDDQSPGFSYPLSHGFAFLQGASSRQT